MTDEDMIEGPDGCSQIERLRAIMHRLRAPGGCPWDAEQTHRSLIPNLIEEAYECVDAIQRDDQPHLEEELGDLLLQVVFHSELASEAKTFDFDDVACGISEKLIRRHPHVFGEQMTLDSGQVLTQWEDIKRAERGDEKKPYLHKVGEGLPALLKAAKLQKKASKVGFDWPSPDGILQKIEEEFSEVKEALDSGSADELEAEIGDLLFVVTNLARKLKIDPEAALERTNQKFLSRFAHLERRLEGEGLSLDEASLEQMDDYWNEARRADQSRLS